MSIEVLTIPAARECSIPIISRTHFFLYGPVVILIVRCANVVAQTIKIKALDYHTKIWLCDTIVCLFMVRSIGKKLERRKSMRPDHLWSCVGPHARTKLIV